MFDAIMIGLIIVCFVLAGFYAIFLDRLLGPPANKSASR